MKTGADVKISNKNVVAVILAGGSGSRAGNYHKQFSKVCGKPLIAHSLEVFLNFKNIDFIVVVVPVSKIEYMSRLLNKIDNPLRKKIYITEGGKNRRESAFISLEYIIKNISKSYEYVFFHDAARPIISVSLLKKLYTEALNHGASTVGVPAIDLLFFVNGGFIEDAVNKLGFYYGFTPQCLPFDLIWKSHLLASKRNMVNDIDNIELLKRFSKSIKIKIIEDCYPNIKFTYKEDKKILNFLLSYGK